MSENKIPIPGRIYNAAVGGHVAGTEDIIDDNKNKTQQEINTETDNRLQSLESTVGEGGSIDERIATAKSEIEGSATSACDTLGKAEALISAEKTRAQAAEADRYTKSETYTKEEVNGLITTPNQDFVSVEATAQTTSIADVLPITGETDTIYRIGNWDGTQYNDSVFSEYAWNGIGYVKLSVKSQVGEVYDISANHSDTKYADLAAALGTNGVNIPQSLQKGGMSVKYVQSSDNKYVQYRLMADEWSTTVTDWQGVDDEPTAGSSNLVTSGGVSKAIGVNLIGSSVMTDTSLPIRVAGKRINGYGYVNPDANAVCILLPCTKGDIVYLKADASTNCKYAYLPSNNIPVYQTISFCDGTTMFALGGEIVLNDIPSDCNYLYVFVGEGESVYLENLISNCDFVHKHEKNITDLQVHAEKTDREFGFYYTGAEAALASCPYRITGLFIKGDGIVASQSAAICLIIPFENGERIIVNGGLYCKYAFLKSNKLVAGNTAPFCDGYNSTIGAQGLCNITAVSDCKYLYVLITNTAGNNFLNYIQSGTNGNIEKLQEQLPQLYYKAFSTNVDINKFFKELYFTADADYTLVKKMRVTNCYLDSSKYYVGVTFRNAQNQTIYGTNYSFDSLAAAQAFKKEIFTNPLSLYVSVHHFYAIIDYDSLVAEGEATDWLDVTLIEAVNNIHLSPSIEEYLHNEKLSINAYNESAGKYLRFAMFSDPHYSGNDSEEAVYRNNLLINTINKIQKDKPLQFIISGGDTGIGSINNGVLADPLPDFRETFLTKFPTQFFSALGNHDGFTVEQWKDAFYHDTQFSFETDGYYFIFLDVYMDGVYDGNDRVLTHILRCFVGTDTSSALRQLLAQYDVDVDAKGYCVLQDVLDIPELAAQFTCQVNYEYQGIDFEFLEAELEKAKALNKKPFVVAHTVMDDVQENKTRFAYLMHDYNAIFLKGHEHYSEHLWVDPTSPRAKMYVSCPGWFALDWGGYGGNQTPWAVDVIEIADNGNLRVMHYIPAQTHTRSGQTYNIPESVEEYTIEASGKSLIRATFDLKDFNNNAKAD